MASKDPHVRTVTDSVSVAHPDVSKQEIEELAEAALDRTEDAPIQNYRTLLAEKEVRDRIAEDGPGATKKAEAANQDDSAKA